MEHGISTPKSLLKKYLFWQLKKKKDSVVEVSAGKNVRWNEFSSSASGEIFYAIISWLWHKPRCFRDPDTKPLFFLNGKTSIYLPVLELINPTVTYLVYDGATVSVAAALPMISDRHKTVLRTESVRKTVLCRSSNWIDNRHKFPQNIRWWSWPHASYSETTVSLSFSFSRLLSLSFSCYPRKSAAADHIFLRCLGSKVQNRFIKPGWVCQPAWPVTVSLFLIVDFLYCIYLIYFLTRIAR